MKDSYEFNIARIEKNGYLSKPEKLMQVFIKCLCPENGVVLDPFMGSGTNAIISAKLNRRFIGIELNKDNLDKSKIRMETSLCDVIKKEERLSSVECIFRQLINSLDSMTENQTGGYFV
jgi:DNA modification methylase